MINSIIVLAVKEKIVENIYNYDNIYHEKRNFRGGSKNA